MRLGLAVLILSATSPLIGQVAVSPSTAAVTPGQTVSLAAVGAGASSGPAIAYATGGATPIAYATGGATPIAVATGTGSACTWTSPNPSALTSTGNGTFVAHTSGAYVVTANCGGVVASSGVVVPTTLTGSPITITAGGTYSGTYVSSNPSIPAVTINTDAAVTLQNCFLSSKGMLIVVNGISAANVTVQNCTVVSIDPGVSGSIRGELMNATHVALLNIHNVSVYGPAYGIELNGGTMTSLSIRQNAVYNLEDRASDGAGGFVAGRPTLGHFIFMDAVTLPNGADLGWNTIAQTIGSSSNEDVFSIFKSTGTAAHPINVHDNYIEGLSSFPAIGTTGTGIITDGNRSAPTPAYVTITANTMVHMSGTGFEIASGHDVTASANRIVSCGVTPSGTWYSATFANAWDMYDAYNAGASGFYNNVINGTYGGFIRQNGSNQPMVSNFYVQTGMDPSNTYDGQNFTNPCLGSGGTINYGAEATERANWAAKVAAAGITIGDQHTL